MASVEVRGYVNFPENKTSKGGKAYAKYSVGVKQKDKDRAGNEVVTYANFQVSDYKNGTAPEKGAFVTVKGYLKVREAEVNGVKRTFLEVNAQEVEVAAPFNDAAEPDVVAAPTPGTKDPWED